MKRTQRDKVFAYIKKEYLVSPEYPWEKPDTAAVFRHKDNRKWFALVMDVGGDKVGLDSPDSIPVLNLKIDDPVLHDILTDRKGILPAYHMNKQHWITVRLNGDVPDRDVYGLIDASYLATVSKKKKPLNSGD